MANIPSENIQNRAVAPFIDMERTPLKEKKTADYNRKVAEAIYSRYVNNRTEVHWNRHERFEYLRAIGQGKQSVDIYKRYFSNRSTTDYSDVRTAIDEYFENSADANRYGWMNVIWDNLSPVANIKTMIKSFIAEHDYDVIANVVDMDAMAEEDREMTRHYVLAQNKELFKALRSKWGLPQIEQDIISDKPEDLLDIKRQGGFKPHHISAIQQVLRHIEQYSEWDKSLKEKILDDYFDLGIAFAVPSYSPTTYKTQWEYVDPADAVVQYSRRFDFKDSAYFGHFTYPTINEIRYLQDKINNGQKYGLNDTDWQKIGKMYSDYLNNPTQEQWDKTRTDEEVSSLTGDSRICVFNIYWKDFEVEKYVEFKNPYGKEKMRDYKEGEKVKSTDKMIQSRTEKVYGCKWIVGTNYVWDFGAVPNQPRKNKKEVMLPFSGFKMLEKSFTARLEPAAHLFAIGWVRLCNAIAKAQNDFYYIDINALAEIDDGGKKLKWTDLIDMMREENVLLGDSTRQTPMYGGSGAPIQKIAGTLMEDMLKEKAVMDEAYSLIEQITGFSPVTLGATPTAEQAVGNTEFSVNASNRAVKQLINGVMRVKEGLADVSVPMTAMAMKYDEECFESWARVIGQDDAEVIRDYDWSECELGITLRARPSVQLKQQLLKIAELAVQDRRQGIPGLDASQMMWLQYHLDAGGDFLEAFYKMQYWIRQDAERMKIEKEQAIKVQSEEIQRQTQLAAEEERKTEAMKIQEGVRSASDKARQDVIVDDNNAINELNKLKAQYLMEQGQDPGQVINQIVREKNAVQGANNAPTAPQINQMTQSTT